MSPSIRYSVRSRVSNAAWFMRSYLDIKRERFVYAAWDVFMPVHRAIREYRRRREGRSELWTIKEEVAANGEISTYFDC